MINKDVFIRYYNGELDNIREVNAINPTNFIEYDLATGEYLVVRNNIPVKGGKICGYENVKLQEFTTKTPVKAENDLITSQSEKKENELASQNIGPVSKPEIKELTGAVEKTNVQPVNEEQGDTEEVKTQKLYYPNGNLRKTIKTKGSRTEEVKEYSKTGKTTRQKMQQISFVIKLLYIICFS